MKETVLVSGASSQLGVFLLPRLQDAGFSVCAYSRRAPASPVKVSEAVCWARPTYRTGLAACLVSCGPLEFAVELVSGCKGLKRMVAFSTTSVWTKTHSKNPEESAQMAKITGQEKRLREACHSRSIALMLIRPTLIYGCGKDRNISLMARFGRRFGFIPVASASSGLRQPVHADDLAALAVRGLQSETPLRLESAACGGTTLSYREMLEKTAAACGKGVRLVTLNTRILAAAARVAPAFPGLRGVNAEMVNRQGRDMIFDDSKLRRALVYEPRPFQPVAGDFQIPGFAMDLQLPR